MLSALAAMVTALFTMGALFHSYPLGNSTLGVTSIAMIMLFLLAFETGPGPLFFILASETFPTSIRNEALALANALQAVMNIMVSFTFPIMLHAFGDPDVSVLHKTHLHGTANTFLLFGGIAMASW